VGPLAVYIQFLCAIPERCARKWKINWMAKTSRKKKQTINDFARGETR
jgi:hypothetical protein